MVILQRTITWDSYFDEASIVFRLPGSSLRADARHVTQKRSASPQTALITLPDAEYESSDVEFPEVYPKLA